MFKVNTKFNFLFNIYFNNLTNLKFQNEEKINSRLIKKQKKTTKIKKKKKKQNWLRQFQTFILLKVDQKN